jgi:hypothetical protein
MCGTSRSKSKRSGRTTFRAFAHSIVADGRATVLVLIDPIENHASVRRHGGNVLGYLVVLLRRSRKLALRVEVRSLLEFASTNGSRDLSA